MACINAKKRYKKERQVRRAKKKREIEAQRAKPPTPTRAIDVLIGDKEQKKNKQVADQKLSHPGPFGRLLGPARIIRWAYSNPSAHINSSFRDYGFWGVQLLE